MGREIIASVSDPKAGGAKRVARAVYNSASPDPTASVGSRAASVERLNGTAASPQPELAGPSARERTIALLDVPDTVNDARIHELLKPYGAIRKVVLRPDHQGALVEFIDVQGLGAAELALGDGLEISDGRKIRLGTYEELRATGREYKVNKLTASAPKKKDSEGESGNKDVPSLPFGSRISRPAQRGGRRGGLGLKNSGVGFGGPRAKPTEAGETKDVEMKDTETSGALNGGRKTNADFRALFVKSKEGEGDA